ncbi:putative DNA-binding domain-containing protein [Motilimonas sp. KMU-193]|uniref:HvfC/BufC family peptide modification chaperone n=1 Tax=Motilimonas sp. KMU-193 TaxID=3388668 RepID=UPI00396B08BA
MANSDSIPLSELQRAFAASLCGQELIVTQHIADHTLAAQQVLQIYQNNFLVSCCDALQVTYQYTQQLIGEACFKQLARQWIRQNPPASGNIIEYGEGFAPWLANVEQLTSLPYLADFAGLEWRLEQTCNAEVDETLFPFTTLAKVTESCYGDLAFQLAPQFSLMASDYAISEIYHMLQQQQVEPFDYHRPAYVLLQKRPDFTVQLHSLDALGYQFLSACQQGMSLGDINQVMALDPSAYLQQFIQQGVLNRFACKEV